MSMDQSFAEFEWKPQASAGKRSQVEMPFLGLVASPHLLDAFVLERISFNGALNEAAKFSGKEDQQLADEIHISPGYMSRFMRGVGQQWAKRLVAHMNATNSRAAVQWIAHQVGGEFVAKDRRAVEVATLKARLQELEGARA